MERFRKNKSALPPRAYTKFGEMENSFILLAFSILFFARLSSCTFSTGFYANNPAKFSYLTFLCYYHSQNVTPRFETKEAQCKATYSEMTICMQVFWPKSSMVATSEFYISKIEPFEYFSKGDLVGSRFFHRDVLAEGDGFFVQDVMFGGFSFFVFWHPERPLSNIGLLRQPIFPAKDALLKFRDSRVEIVSREIGEDAAQKLKDPSKLMILGKNQKPIMSFAKLKSSPRFKFADSWALAELRERLLSAIPGSGMFLFPEKPTEKLVVLLHELFAPIPPNTAIATWLCARDRIEKNLTYGTPSKYSCILTCLPKNQIIVFEFDAILVK